MLLARDDLRRREFRRAKDRLRVILRSHPQLQPALELMGHIYCHHKDHRNAVMYWAQAGRWHAPMRHACDQVFKSIGKALASENLQAARHLLYAFAGCQPPPDIGERLAAFQSAYFKLDGKRSKRMGMACAPVAGGCLFAMLLVFSAILGEGWAWFAPIGVVALTTTAVVLAINAFSYIRASRLFREALDALGMHTADK